MYFFSLHLGYVNRLEGSYGVCGELRGKGSVDEQRGVWIAVCGFVYLLINFFFGRCSLKLCSFIYFEIELSNEGLLEVGLPGSATEKGGVRGGGK